MCSATNPFCEFYSAGRIKGAFTTFYSIIFFDSTLNFEFYFEFYLEFYLIETSSLSFLTIFFMEL